jgi:hypothetical protein
MAQSESCPWTLDQRCIPCCRRRRSALPAHRQTRHQPSSHRRQQLLLIDPATSPAPLSFLSLSRTASFPPANKQCAGNRNKTGRGSTRARVPDGGSPLDGRRFANRRPTARFYLGRRRRALQRARACPLDGRRRCCQLHVQGRALLPGRRCLRDTSSSGMRASWAAPAMMLILLKCSARFVDNLCQSG